eukprot:CAMPEP_0204503288 /NCGR_PEP_ID=MMETSP0471-20130131/103091_1 /ASSEMBLY_ACC=CAM_ASM_000602 /TAXON_ID=2969 /ORGANISM="Oxyrrhis marina" /LENGTH=52 /DNA_ID=CAMNT_0051508089 /DNA_START=104 /DNA_END=259 /DNA_ORIENTATION=+
MAAANAICFHSKGLELPSGSYTDLAEITGTPCSWPTTSHSGARNLAQVASTQ